MEYALQCSLPFLLLAFVRPASDEGLSPGGNPELRKQRQWLIVAGVCCCLTFIGHALYAMGVYAQPGHFVSMIIDTLGTSEAASYSLLFAAGVLDCLAALLLVLPSLRVFGLSYMFAWGLLTALARTVANVSAVENLYGLDPWLVETFVRTSHWAVPLAMLLLLRANSSQTRESNA